MTKIDWKRKLSSRKLWAAVVGVVIGLAAAFGIDEGEYTQIAGIVTSAVSVVAYIFGEAATDAAGASAASGDDEQVQVIGFADDADAED